MSKTNFKMEAPLVWNDGFVPSSGYSRIATSFGRILGGMSVDGHSFRLDGTDFGLACAQIIMTEADVKETVMGVSYSVDGKSSFIAMSDGSIWKIAVVTMGGKLVTEGNVATDEESAQECSQSVAMHEALLRLAVKSLAGEGQIIEGDTYSGHVMVDPHSAILMRPMGYGALIVVGKDGTDKSGWRFSLDAPRNADIDEASSLLAFVPMTREEIKEERTRYAIAASSTVEGNPFPQRVGMA